MEPALELLSAAVVEDAHHAGLNLDASTPCAHDAERADVLVVAEDVVLGEPKAVCSQLAEPRHDLVSTLKVSRHRACTGEVPNHIGGEKASQGVRIGRPEGFCRAAICEGVRMLTAHGRNDTTWVEPQATQNPGQSGLPDVAKLAAQVAELRARGSRIETIFPDSDSRNAFGVSVMDPSTRPPAARAGHNQGRALAEQLNEFWR
jgi:hypothetical protein